MTDAVESLFSQVLTVFPADIKEHASASVISAPAVKRTRRASTVKKAPGAFLTIGEVAEQLGVEQHVLRFWEAKFPQIEPLKRAGGRRYYRPQDVAIITEIHSLLYKDGYTIKGAQKYLAEHAGSPKKTTLGLIKPPEDDALQPPAALAVVAPPTANANSMDAEFIQVKKTDMHHLLDALVNLRQSLDN